MTEATLKQLDEAQEKTALAKKQLDATLEEYIAARQASLDALKTHNETG